MRPPARPHLLAATGPLAITAAPIVPAAVLGHVRDWNTLYGPFPGTDTALCGDETVVPGGGDCGPCRCIRHAGHVPPTSITEWDPDADHKCACGDRWDDPTEPNTAEPQDRW